MGWGWGGAGLGKQPKWEAAEQDELQSLVGQGGRRLAAHSSTLFSQGWQGLTPPCRPQSSPHPSHPLLLTEGQGALPLTSIVLSPIHLIIHIHGQFLKQPVAELEAEKGTQGLSG